MRKTLALSLLVLAAGLRLTAVGASARDGSIIVDAAVPGPVVPPTLYGIFFEEISHAGEGGLYAELIRNRGFEDANVPPSCRVENGVLIPPRTPHFWRDPEVSAWTMPWTVTSRWPGWSLETTGGASAAIDLVDVEPLTGATPHSLQVTIASLPAGDGRVAIANEGFWGISVTDGRDYRLRFHARSGQGFAGPLRASLEGADGQTIASETFTAPPAAWTQYRATLRAGRTDPHARFVLSFGSTGRVWVDFVSLFPADTFHGRPDGLRRDLAETIAALKPAFIRWPGGCFVEGITIQTRARWKTTLGPVEERPGTFSPWGYWSSDGFGYREFLQFAEDIGADALYVANAGVSCAFRSGTYLPDADLPDLIEDTLNAIEYAIGPVTSTWGSLRAKHGHPTAFPLKYVEIGNEQQGSKYGRRVAAFSRAIKARYPGIKIALSSWIAGIDRDAIAAARPIDIVDEHAYKPLHWAVEHFDSFATYPREGWDLYIGEFATNGGVGRGNLLAALNDAAYMMSMEKNGDLVKMGSYAPLLENVNHPDWQVNLIHFDSARVYGRASYYVNRLFAENRPDVNLPVHVSYAPQGDRPIGGRIGLGTYNTAAEFRDVRVESAGRTVYRSHFDAGSEGWQPAERRPGPAGTWRVVDGAYRQEDRAIAWSYIGDDGWRDVTLSVKARKLSGDEGFLVAVGSVDGRRVQFNIGGWGNRRHALQAADAIVGDPASGGVETGRWYDVMVETRGREARAYLDGTLVAAYTFPRVDTVLAIAGRNDTTGDIIVKVVNTSDRPARLAVTVSGAPRILTGGHVTTLTSAKPTDENSFDEPTKVVPVTRPLTVSAEAFAHDFPAYSLSILRLPTRNRRAGR